VIAREHDHLEPLIGRPVEHGLNPRQPRRVGVDERIVEHDRQAATVLFGEDLRHRHAEGGRELFASTATQPSERHGHAAELRP